MQIDFGVRDVRGGSCHDLTQQRAQRKHVGACRQVVRTASGLLGRHKGQGPKDETLAGQGACMLLTLLRNRSVRIGIIRGIANRLNDRFHGCLLRRRSENRGRTMHAQIGGVGIGSNIGFRSSR